MTQYLMLGFGGIALLGGLFFKRQYEGELRYERVFAIIAYAGWVLIVLPGAQMLQPLFNHLSGNWPNTARAILEVVLFIVGAEFILKKVFDPNAVDTVDPTKRGRRNGQGKSDTINSYGSFKKKK